MESFATIINDIDFLRKTPKEEQQKMALEKAQSLNAAFDKMDQDLEDM